MLCISTKCVCNFFLCQVHIWLVKCALTVDFALVTYEEITVTAAKFYQQYSNTEADILSLSNDTHPDQVRV